MIIEIWQVFVDPNNLFFSVCLTVCVLIIALEIIGLLVGASNEWLDNLLPDSLKVDLDGVGASHGVLVTLSSWIYLGRMPFLIWLIIFFGGWGIVGLLLQMTLNDVLGMSFTQLVAVPVALAINLFVVRYLCMAINPFIPKDETYAVESSEFIGLDAEIVIGVAKHDYPAQAKLKDRHGTTHYIMVVPPVDAEFKQGDKVVVTAQKDGVFEAIELGEFNKLTYRE